MLSSILKLAEEYVWVPQIAIGPALSRLVSELLGDLQPVGVVPYGAREVTQQVTSVAQVAARATHRLPVA